MNHPNRSAHISVVVAATLLVVSGVMPTALLPAMAVQIKRSFALTDPQVGGLLSLYFGVSFTLAVMSGRLADRLGPLRAAYVGAALTIVALLGTGTIADGFFSLAALYVVGGSGQSIIAPTANVILATGIPRRRLGLAMGIKQSAIPLGSLLAGLAVPLVALRIGWRWAFILASVLPVLAVANMRNFAFRTGSPSEPVSRSPGRSTSFRRLPVYVVGASLGTMTGTAVTGFLVLSVVRSGFSESSSGILLAAAAIAATFVRIASGVVVDKTRHSSGLGAAVLLTIGAVGYVLLASPWHPSIVAGALLAYGAGWGWQGLYHHSLVDVFPRRAGAATGVARIGLASGAAIGPSLFGLLAHELGYETGWMIMATGMFLAAIVLGAGYRLLTRTV